MTVVAFSQPDFTSQEASYYKKSIDDSINVVGNLAKQFAPTEMVEPGMGIMVDAGLRADGTIIAAQEITGIGAPAADPRIDRIYLNPSTGAYGRAVGTEDESPTPPAYPGGTIPICQIFLIPEQTAVLNEHIVDERTVLSGGVGGMSAAVYDWQGVNQQVVGLTAIQTLENKAVRPVLLGVTSSTTLAAGHEGRTMLVADSSPVVITLPENGDVALPDGFEIRMIKMDAGNIEITPDSGVSLNGGSSAVVVSDSYKIVTLTKIYPNFWVVSGA